MDPLDQVGSVGAALTARWLHAEGAAALTLSAPEALPARGDEPGIVLVPFQAADMTGTIAVVPLYDPAGDRATLQAKAAVEQRLATLGMNDLVLWTPPHAELEDDPGDHFSGRIAEAAQGLEPGAPEEVGFPVQLALRKTGEEGSYLNVLGGLHPHWSRFTNQVFGQFQLESSEIHRLPADPQEVTKLIDFIVLLANGLRTVGKITEVKADDTWTLQRLEGLPGPVVLAAAPNANPEDGRGVRRAMRRGIRGAVEALDQRDAGVRLLACVAILRQMENETATIALHGMDPMIFRQFDAGCLVADGRVKPFFGPRASSLLL